MYPTVNDKMASQWEKFFKVTYQQLDEFITDDYYRILFNKLKKDNLTAGNKYYVISFLAWL